MFDRGEKSSFVDNLIIGKRGTIVGTKRTAAGVETKDDAMNVLKKFDKSEDIPNDYIKEHTDRLENDEDPKEVVSDFFQSLHENKKDANKITIHTAHMLRKAGMFKRADKDVYQDTKTSDFWKISDDKKHVMRVFKEIEGGIADRSASKKN
jgi:hypothetical protein